MIYSFSVNKLDISCNNARKIILTDSVQYHIAKFKFDDSWDGFSKTIWFKNKSSNVDDEDVVIPVILGDGDTFCEIPWEVIKRKGLFVVAVQGISGDTEIWTKDKKPIIIEESDKSGDTTPPEPTIPIYNQIINLLSNKGDNLQYSQNILSLKSGDKMLSSVIVDTGNKEIHIGDDEPQDMEVLWIDTDEADNELKIDPKIIDGAIGVSATQAVYDYVNDNKQELSENISDVNKHLENVEKSVTKNTSDIADLKVVDENLTAKTAEIKNNLDNNYYNKDEINNLVSGAFHFKGTADSFDGTDIIIDGQKLTSMQNGDVYQVDDKEYVYNGSKWVELGFNIDLSAYALKTDVSKDIKTAKREMEIRMDESINMSEQVYIGTEVPDKNQILWIDPSDMEGV